MAFINGQMVTGDATPDTTTVTTAQSLTAGNFLVVFIAYLDVAGTTNISLVADTAGNTYIPLATVRFNSVTSLIAYTYNVTGHAANQVTVTYSATTQFRSVIIEQYSGVKTSGDPFNVAATPATGTSTTPTSGAFTTTVANTLIISASTGAPTFTAGSGYTLRDSGNFAAMQDQTVSAIQTGATAGFSMSGSADWEMHAAAFELAGGSPSTWGPSLSDGWCRIVQVP